MTLLPSTLLPGLLPFLLPHLLQAQPQTKQSLKGPHCLGSHGKLRVARQVKVTECSHKYLEKRNQGLLSRVIPSGKKARIGAESKIKEAT